MRFERTASHSFLTCLGIGIGLLLYSDDIQARGAALSLELGTIDLAVEQARGSAGAVVVSASLGHAEALDQNGWHVGEARVRWMASNGESFLAELLPVDPTTFAVKVFTGDGEAFSEGHHRILISLTIRDSKQWTVASIEREFDLSMPDYRIVPKGALRQVGEVSGRSDIGEVMNLKHGMTALWLLLVGAAFGAGYGIAVLAATGRIDKKTFNRWASHSALALERARRRNSESIDRAQEALAVEEMRAVRPPMSASLRSQTAEAVVQATTVLVDMADSGVSDAKGPKITASQLEDSYF